MKRQSKKKLFQFLSTHFNRSDVKIGNNGISDETYGKDSRIYLFNITKVWNINRSEMESLLIDNGFPVNKKYGRSYTGNSKDDYDATEVLVTYFKGYHWDE